MRYLMPVFTSPTYCPGMVGTDRLVEIDNRFAEITGALLGATYKKCAARWA
jgi:meso-butanediol dehydrogenase/(S,S)-butanediol dehydrogenase/diacetyl reductase